MARKATGKVIEHEGKDGHTYRALRFIAQWESARFTRHAPLAPKMP